MGAPSLDESHRGRTAEYLIRSTANCSSLAGHDILTGRAPPNDRGATMETSGRFLQIVCPSDSRPTPWTSDLKRTNAVAGRRSKAETYSHTMASFVAGNTISKVTRIALAWQAE